jgi:hypothetical protein
MYLLEVLLRIAIREDTPGWDPSKPAGGGLNAFRQ